VAFGSKEEIKKWLYRADSPPAVEDLIEMLSFFFGGGTDFEAPLGCALDLIRSEGSLKKADVIFITDGECDVSDEFVSDFRKAKKELEFRVYTVLISQRTRSVDRFSDEVLTIDDLTDDQHVLDTIYAI